MQYERAPDQIYRQSFATIRAEVDLSIWPENLHPLIVRLVHACGMTDIVEDLHISPELMNEIDKALSTPTTFFCDSEMVAAGIIKKRLAPHHTVQVTLNNALVPDLAKQLDTTRSAAAVELWRDEIENAVIVIGNAPTALFHLLERLEAGWPRPKAILAFPVGFIGAAESKAALVESAIKVPYATLLGRRGGSAMASAAANALIAGIPEEGNF